MSRIGKKPIVIPAGVKVACTGALVQVEGPRGKLQYEHPPEVSCRDFRRAGAGYTRN